MKILFISEIDFEHNNASTLRVKNLAHVINDTGFHDILIIGYGNKDSIISKRINILQVKRGTSLLSKIYHFYIRGIEVIRKIDDSGFNPDIIIYNGCYTRFLFPLIKYSRKRKIKLVVDIVEWYDYWHLLRYYFNPFLVLDVHVGITKLIKKCDGVIAISSFLEIYFSERSKKTIRIPVILNALKERTTQSTIPSFDKNKLNLIYAGVPGKKDLLNLIIRVVEKLSVINDQVCLHVLGLNNEGMRNYYGRDFSKNIICYGNIEQSLVPEYLYNADFSVLLRPPKRYAQAGFPTKFVESLNSGLPVIANCTSDICLYLKDGENGFIINDCSEKAISEKIQEIFEYGRDRWTQMRKNAKQTFIKNFEMKDYSVKLNEFLSNI